MPALSAVVMQHFMEPHHAGALVAPDAEGWSGSVESSRFMRIQLHVRDGLITAARFGTYGCAPAIAAGDYLCEQVEGKSVKEARLWRSEALLEALGGLPEHRHHCAALAVDALHQAIAFYHARENRHE